jgi:hypothetical protein
MQPAAQLANPPAGSWRVSREGSPVATVGMRSERGEVVVATGIEGVKAPKPYRFGSIEEADAFIGDLMTSFAYLGCDVAAE